MKTGVPKPMARTDRSMLVALTDPDVVKHLTDSEREAFRDMLSRLESGRGSKLSNKQRDWVEGVYMKLHLDAHEPSENLFSSGKVKPDTSGKKYGWELQPLPLKPPGRK